MSKSTPNRLFPSLAPDLPSSSQGAIPYDSVDVTTSHRGYRNRASGFGWKRSHKIVADDPGLVRAFVGRPYSGSMHLTPGGSNKAAWDPR